MLKFLRRILSCECSPSSLRLTEEPEHERDAFAGASVTRGLGTLALCGCRQIFTAVLLLP